MDNGAVSSASSEVLIWAYSRLNGISNPYKFELQQLHTNDNSLQAVIESEQNSDNIDCEKTALTDLFGLRENKEKDSLLTQKKQLNVDLGWGTVLTADLIKTWVNIAKQVNASLPFSIPRFIGNRDGDFQLVAFVDSSKLLYGVTVYIKDLQTNRVSFLTVKNRMIGKSLESKSIPCLVLSSILLGCELLVELCDDLAGNNIINPINITKRSLYSDSLVALSWITSYANKLEKMNKQGVFIINRLEKIEKLYFNRTIEFSFIKGNSNPADCITRPLSYKLLLKSNYHTGPEFLSEKDRKPHMSRAEIMAFTLPKQEANSISRVVNSTAVFSVAVSSLEHLIPLERYSSLTKLIAVHSAVRKAAHLFKPQLGNISLEVNSTDLALTSILKEDQEIHLGEVLQYFSCPALAVKAIPPLITQLN